MKTHLEFSRPMFSTIALALVALGTSASGATLVLEGVERFNAAMNPPQDLTAKGEIDWAYWATEAASLTPPVAPTNEKSGGTSIGSLSAFGGGNLRGSTTAFTAGRYSFTDGTSPVSATNTSLEGLIFNSNLGASAVGKGFELSIAGDPALDRIVTLYLGGFAATGTLTLTLNGVAVPVTDSSQVFTGISPKPIAAYTVRFRPDSADDLLNVRYVASAVTDVNSGHVGMEAVAVVPEPGVVSLACLGALALGVRRRRTV